MAIALMSGAIGCSVNVLESKQDESLKIVFEASPFVDGDREISTRTSVVPNESYTVFDFIWSAKDTVGIYPDAGSQVFFTMENGAGASSATFDGGAWTCKDGYVYRSYYPFIGDIYLDKTKIPVSFLGQKQVGNANSDHFQKYDYMYTAAATKESGFLNFTYKHLGTVVLPWVELPAGHYTGLTLSLDEALFVTEGEYDLTAASPAIVGKKYSDSMSIELDITLTSPDILKVYVPLAPMDMSGKTLTITITDENESEYQYTYNPSKSYSASNIYRLKAATSLVQPEDLSTNETANCYIVPGPGKYKFKAVKGNSSESVGDVKGVKVLWESFGNNRTPEVGEIIKADASFMDGYIVFSTNDSYAEGNALIAAFSDEECTEGNVLWSWHLWVTSTDLNAAAEEYNNGAGIMMDRNLGALSSNAHSINENSAGLLYQWGRKDPFLSSYLSVGDNNYVETTASVSMPESVDVNTSTGTIDYSVKHPQTFIKGEDWLWNAENQSDDSRWDLEKTIFDPCPPGYKVPDSRIWNVALGRLGFHYGFSAGDYKFVLSLSDHTVYYPYSKIRSYRSGYLNGLSDWFNYDACAYWGIPENNNYDVHAPALFGTAYDRLILVVSGGMGGNFTFKGSGNMIRCVSESSRPIVMPESLDLDQYSIQIEPHDVLDLETLNPKITPEDANVTSVSWSTSYQQGGYSSIIEGHSIGTYKAYCYSSLYESPSKAEYDNLMKECSIIVCPYEPSSYYNGGWYLNAKAGDTISFSYYIGDDDDGENYFDIYLGNTLVFTDPDHYSSCSGSFSYTFEEGFTGWLYMDWGWGCNIWNIETTATVTGRGEVEKRMDDRWKQYPSYIFNYKDHQLAINE